MDEPIEPGDVLKKHYSDKGELKLLVKWKGKSSLEHSWLDYQGFITRFPSYQSEGKLDFVGGSIDKFKRLIIERGRVNKLIK